jgi:hypothetical protein
MGNNNVTFKGLAAKTIVVHTITYFIMGLAASLLLNYKENFASPEFASWMRPVNDPLVMAGPLFQPIRGLIFASVFYPLREILFNKKYGWLIILWMLVGLGILSTFGPPPGSVEGFIYTRISISKQIAGWIEVIPQAFLLSVLVFYWMNHPEKKWLNWTMGIAFGIIVLLILAGLLAR